MKEITFKSLPVNKRILAHAVSFSALKDFVTFGDNAVLREVQIKKEADRKFDERADELKGKTNYVTWALVLIAIGIVGFIIMMGMSQFFNYTEATGALSGCESARATCNTQLSILKTGGNLGGFVEGGSGSGGLVG